MIQVLGWALLLVGVWTDIFALIAGLKWNRGKHSASSIPFFPFLFECWGLGFLAKDYVIIKAAFFNAPGAVFLGVLCFHLLCQWLLPWADKKMLHFRGR